MTVEPGTKDNKETVTQAAAQTQEAIPVTGDTKTEKAIQYLKRLRANKQFDPNLPLSNADADKYAKEISKLGGEEVSPGVVKHARTQILKEPVQGAIGQGAPGSQVVSKGGEASRPILKEPVIIPGEGQGEAGTLPPPPKEERKPLNPEEIEGNRKFWDRTLSWLGKKAEAKVDPDDQGFIVGTLTDALTEARSKVPIMIKVVIVLAMVITLYILPAVEKVKSKLPGRKKQTEAEQRPPGVK